MGDFVTYPLDQSYLSAFTADVWNTAIPLPEILAMFSAPSSSTNGTQHAPGAPWRPSKSFPPQRCVRRSMHPACHLLHTEPNILT